jgi:hypothetical protein
MEKYNSGAMLGTKSIVSEFNKGCARLESSVVVAESEVTRMLTRTRKTEIGFLDTSDRGCRPPHGTQAGPQRCGREC